MTRPKAASPNLELSQTLKQLFPSLDGDMDAPGLKLLAHEHIAVRPQPRVHFSPDEVAELSHSISQLRERGEGIEGTGILQPLIVAPIETDAPEDSDSSNRVRYRLIAGERRFRASLQAGLPHVPVLVLPMREDGILLAQLVENLQRQGLAPLDEARGLQQLMSEQGLSYRDAAKVLGKSRSYLTDRLALLKMGEDVQSLVSARPDTMQHARFIDAVQDAPLRQELIELTRQGTGRREIERRIEAASNLARPSNNAAGSPTTSSRASDSSDSVDSARQVSGRADTSGDRETKESSHGESSHGEGSHVAPKSPELGHGLTQQESPQRLPDLLAHLKPATAMVAEAAHLAEEHPTLTHRQVAEVKNQLAALALQIGRIEAKL